MSSNRFPYFSGRGSSRNAGSASAVRNPYFGIEIEIFLRVKTGTQSSIRDLQRRRAKLPSYWQEWDFDLNNDDNDKEKKKAQRQRVCQAVIDILNKEFASKKHNWVCKEDGTLHEDRVEARTNRTKYCKSPS